MLIIVFLAACVHVEELDPPPIDDAQNEVELVIPDGFDFGNTREVAVEITMPSTIVFGDYKGRFDLLSDRPENGGKHQLTGSFDDQGRYEGILEIPASQNQVFFTSLVTDSLYDLPDYNQLISHLTIDLSDFYAADPNDSIVGPEIVPNNAANIGPPVNARALDLVAYILNGDFSEDNYGISNTWS